MKLPPIASAIGREALIVIAGAIVAAAIMGQLPTVKAWVKRQWE